MRGWFAHNPHRVWWLGLALLPLWLALASWGWSGVDQLPLPGSIEPAAGRTVEGGGSGLVKLGSLENYRPLWQRSLRQRLIEPEEPPEPEPQPQERPLRFTLFGTVVEGERSYAILRDDQGQMVLAKLGTQLNAFVVASIEADRVGLRRDGTMHYLRLPEELRRLLPRAARAQRAALSSGRADRTSVEQTGAADETEAEAVTVRLANLSSEQFMQETRMMPATNARGVQIGFRLDSIARNSAVRAQGLRSGDVILAIDASPLEQLADLERIYRSLDQGQRHEWRVLRDDQPVRVEVIPFQSVKESDDERQ